MLFNTAIDQLNAVAAKIEAQIEQLQNQLSQVQSQIQAVRSVEQAAESAIGQVRQAINGIRTIDPTLENDFRDAILDQFGASPESLFLTPTPDAPEPGGDQPDAPTPTTIEVVPEGRLTDSLRKMQDELQEVEDRIVEMEMGGTVLTVTPPEDVERPTLMGYTVKELRRAIGELNLEQPPSKASKMELIRYLDSIPNAKLRDALTAATL